MATTWCKGHIFGILSTLIEPRNMPQMQRNALEISLDFQFGPITAIFFCTRLCCAVAEVDVSIVDPADSTLPVRHGSSFSLKCVARVRRPLDSSTSSFRPRPGVAAVSTGLRWLHDGQPLADGTGDGLCGRVVITDVVDVDTGLSHYLLTLISDLLVLKSISTTAALRCDNER